MMLWKILNLTLICCYVVGCAGEEAPGPGGCKASTDCAGTPDTPLCEVASGACVALPPGHEIGWKDGSPGSVALVPVYEPDALREPTDLAFNPAKPTELWVIDRADDSVTILEDPGMPDATWEYRHDPAAYHFMDRPPALAFGAESASWGMTWATCGDSDNGGNDFMGPALFSADLDIFAKETPGGLGSHLDMLHSTTFCRGIAHEDANIYWVFNSTAQSIDKYDFHQDHGPGNDDHSDGEIFRYVRGYVLGVDGIPSHLIFDPEDKSLYIADTGNMRIAKLDTQSGVLGTTFAGQEPASRRYVNEAVITDVVPPGTLQAPSGIELHEGLLYVTDNATSRFYAFDLDGQTLRTLDTGLPPGSLAGLAFGADGKVYFTDLLSNRVYRIDPLF